MQNSTTIIGVLEMIEDGFSQQDIRARFAIGNSTITNIKTKFKSLDVSLKELRSVEPKAIERLFYGNSHPRKEVPFPNYDQIYKELTRQDSRTNLYFLWIEYKKIYSDGYQYTQFKHYFKKWLNENHLEDNLRMAVERLPGEIMYLDWIGDKINLVLTDIPGELKEAHFFVATIGVSSYCFSMAFPDEKTESFLRGTIEALNFYQGVPKIIKPDNTKAVSIKNNKDVLILNKMYEDIQEFYKTVIVPAPPRKPTAKSTVENHVRWLETHLLERLKGRWFESFTDLNTEIFQMMEELNERPFSKGKGNRKEMFEKYDKPVLKRLPSESLKVYKYLVKIVPNNYHIEYDEHYYSVPYHYYKQEVTIKASSFDIIICDPLNQLICKHTRLYKPFPKYSTIEEHMPKSHLYYKIENTYDGEAYKNWAKSYGQNLYELICKVIATFQYEQQSYKSCNGILHLCKDYPKSLIDVVAKECLESNIFNYSHFKKILNKNSSKSQAKENIIPKHENIRGKSNYE